VAINQNWKISKRARSCSETEQSFNDGDHFYTAIFEHEEEDNVFIRKDFSEPAWEALIAAEDQPKPFSFWRSKFEIPEVAEDPSVMKKETAEGLLDRLMEEDRPESENARFILAVMLERDKLLKEIDTKDTDEAKFRIYEKRANGDVLIIRDPELKLDDVDGIQEQVMMMLDGNAPPTEGEGSDGEAPESESENSTTEKETLESPPSSDSGDDQADGDGDASPVEVAAEEDTEQGEADSDDGDLPELDADVEAEQGDEDLVS